MKYLSYDDLLRSEKDHTEYEAHVLGESFLSSISRYMEQNLVSHADLAQRLGCDCSVVDRIFHSGRNLNLVTMASILKALDLRARFDLYRVPLSDDSAQPTCFATAVCSTPLEDEGLAGDEDLSHPGKP